MRKIKLRIKKILYRLLRDDMVLRMRTMGFTWSKMNTVLESFGQKVIVTAEPKKNGIRIVYGAREKKEVKITKKNRLFNRPDANK